MGMNTSPDPESNEDSKSWTDTYYRLSVNDQIKGMIWVHLGVLEVQPTHGAKVRRLLGLAQRPSRLERCVIVEYAFGEGPSTITTRDQQILGDPDDLKMPLWRRGERLEIEDEGTVTYFVVDPLAPQEYRGASNWFD